MKERDFAVLRKLKARAEEEEQRDPENEALRAVHRFAFGALCKLRGALNLTDEQFKIIATPQGGGRPKTPPEDP